MRNITLTGKERIFNDDEIIVSKTDRKGIIIYANEVFLRMSGYSENEIIGKPHNIIRHPSMPRAIFKLLWETISSGKECFAYVVNMSKNGDHYWVFAHITPTFGPDGSIISYHSNRRAPRRDAIVKAERLYGELRAIERSADSPAQGMKLATHALENKLAEIGVPYDEFVFAL